MQMMGVLIVDDHPVYRDALTERLGTEFSAQAVGVVGVGSAESALNFLAQSNKHWVVVLDILMPGLSGMAGIKAFKAIDNVKYVVSLSGLDKDQWEPRCVQAGASLFLSKSLNSPHIFQKLDELLQGADAMAPLPDDGPLVWLEDDLRLTMRQKEVLALIAQGHPNKIIADQLDISEHTVKIHVHQIFKELRVFNRTQAVLKALRLELI